MTMNTPASLTDTLCCVVIKERGDLSSWMLQDKRADATPSLMDKFMCKTEPEAREANQTLKWTRQITALAGVMLQKDENVDPGTATVHTLKWASFDAAKRGQPPRLEPGQGQIPQLPHQEIDPPSALLRAGTVKQKVFGGFGGYAHVGTWTLPANKRQSYAMIFLARLCNYTHKYEFSEDYSRADLSYQINCCCCAPIPPCAPALFTVPWFLLHDEMVQMSHDGSHWHRNTSCCLSDMKLSYNLVAVLKPDGTNARFHDDLAKCAPVMMLISR